MVSHSTWKIKYILMPKTFKCEVNINPPFLETHKLMSFYLNASSQGNKSMQIVHQDMQHYQEKAVVNTKC